MSCGDPAKHPVDGTELGRSLSELEANNPAVDQAAQKMEQAKADLLSDRLASNVADLIAEVAQLDALAGMVKERREKVRTLIQAEADRVSAQTGAAANFPVRGLGRAYVTSPGEALGWDDDDELAAWCKEKAPELVQMVPHIDASALLGLARKDLRLATWLREAAVMRDVPTFDLEALTARALDPQQVTRTPDGTLVDSDGERLPARFRPTSSPTLVVKIEAATKRRLAQQIQAARQLPAGLLE